MIIFPTILHITTPDAWAEAQQQGQYRADSLASEGFIHCSTVAQVEYGESTGPAATKI